MHKIGSLILEQSQENQKKVDVAMKSRVSVVVEGKFKKKDWTCCEGCVCFDKKFWSNECLGQQSSSQIYVYETYQKASLDEYKQAVLEIMRLLQ